jgi:hypothetical protein
MVGVSYLYHEQVPLTRAQEVPARVAGSLTGPSLAGRFAKKKEPHRCMAPWGSMLSWLHK